MQSIQRGWKSRFLQVTLIMILAVSASAQTRNSQLGNVQFPTSGSEKAQAHFLRGLAALHSFWYEEAADAFRESTRVEPDFMMGYWGEAMALNHPLWSEQDTPAAQLVVARIKETPKLSPRERAYLNAVKLLYGEGDKRARDLAYSAAMEKIYREYPNDLDAAAFYSLSLLGLVQSTDKSYRQQARAGAIALEVYQKNPNHPGGRTTSFTPSTIPSTRFWLCPRRVAMRTLPRKRITRVTCRPIFFCNWECGLKPRPRMKQHGKRPTPG